MLVQYADAKRAFKGDQVKLPFHPVIDLHTSLPSLGGI
jgi:hypothetical protein